MEDDLKKNENGRRPQKKWKMKQSTKINLIGCDTIVNSVKPNFPNFPRKGKSKAQKYNCLTEWPCFS